MALLCNMFFLLSISFVINFLFCKTFFEHSLSFSLSRQPIVRRMEGCTKIYIIEYIGVCNSLSEKNLLPTPTHKLLYIINHRCCKKVVNCELWKSRSIRWCHLESYFPQQEQCVEPFISHSLCSTHSSIILRKQLSFRDKFNCDLKPQTQHLSPFPGKLSNIEIIPKTIFTATELPSPSFKLGRRGSTFSSMRLSQKASSNHQVRRNTTRVRGRSYKEKKVNAGVCIDDWNRNEFKWTFFSFSFNFHRDDYLEL